MAPLFKERGTLASSKKEPNGDSLRLSSLSLSTMSSAEALQSPFGELGCRLSDPELRETAYEIFVATSRNSAVKPLIYISQSERAAAGGSATPPSAERSLSSSSSQSSSMQRSLTSTAASKMKKALGLKSSKKSPGKESNPSKTGKRPVTVAELMRVQMGVSDQTDARIRRGLIRIAASQLGKRVECIVVPLELLQQFKASDFPDVQEYEAWRNRNLKVLEAGLLLHPLVVLDKSDVAYQRLRQTLRGALERPIETGKNSESMQALRVAVMSIACRSSDRFSSDVCHWADGFPLNLHLYNMLLEACFDNEEGSILDEIDEIMELIKKTWVILGINQMLHNLCFLWTLFHRFVATGQVDIDLLLAADNQLMEVANDAKATKDAGYAKILSSVLSTVMGWAEKRLLTYHDTFSADNIEYMQYIVSIGVSAAKVLVEDISHEYRRKKKEVDVGRSRIDAYIRSSLKTSFAQMMEKVDSTRRSSKVHSNLPVLSILAKDIGDLANKEKEIFSPLLKRWHPLPAGVAVATLHSCFGNELKQFISSVTELTLDSIHVLKAADKLEKDLVQIAVEDSVDSEDGGKGLIREMPPYEAQLAMVNLTKAWMKNRVDRLREWVDRSLQQEDWKPREENKERFASSSGELLRLVDENLDAFFQLPIPMHPALLPDFISGLDRSLQHYVAKAKTGTGTRNTFIPALPPLTRVEIRSKLWKKKDKSHHHHQPKRNSQVGTMNGDASLSLPQLCVRMNSLHHVRTELENLEKKMKTCLRNAESARSDDITNGFDHGFELTRAACQDGVQHLCETTAYKVVFSDLGHVLWDSLYLGDASASRIDALLRELDPSLETISASVHDRVRNRAVTALMKASFDGYLLVLLAAGPSRSFARHDSDMLEDDFKALRDLFLADGDGLPEELVEKAATQVRSLLPLFRSDTEGLIERFRRLMAETHGGASKSRYPLPPTSGHWSPNDANTVLRVLCYRKDEVASKFLKKTYNLPKKL